MINYSLSEIDSLCRKAARGAGYSWGLSEDTGKGVRWLNAYGLPGAEVLVELLKTVSDDLSTYVPELDGGNCHNNINAMCPIYCGAVINDLGHKLEQEKTITFKSMLYPLLALPQAARISEAYDLSVIITLDNKQIICTRDDISFSVEADWKIKKSDLQCAKNTTVEVGELTSLYPSPQSRPIDAATIDILEHFAHKTYAPATEASRLAGAGAGLSDND